MKIKKSTVTKKKASRHFVICLVAGTAVAAIVAVVVLSQWSSLFGASGRWYQPAQVVAGATIYDQHCLSCHGAGGSGLVKQWKQRLADGTYPPPPLNGTAHTWHHPLSVLERTIRDGTAPLGGQMPAFKDTLTEEERLAVIAYVQSHWQDDIYSRWLARGGLKK